MAEPLPALPVELVAAAVEAAVGVVPVAAPLAPALVPTVAVGADPLEGAVWVVGVAAVSHADTRSIRTMSSSHDARARIRII